MPARPTGTRFIHVHRNIPGVLGHVNEAVSRHGINILAQYLQTDPEVGYVVLETDVVGGEGEGLLADLQGRRGHHPRARAVRAALARRAGRTG